MENIDILLDLLTKHKVFLLAAFIFFTAGGYTIARWRSSGKRKMVKAHEDFLDDLTVRLNKIRKDRDDKQEELSAERSKGFLANEKIQQLEIEIAALQAKIEILEEDKTLLMGRIKEQK